LGKIISVGRQIAVISKGLQSLQDRQLDRIGYQRKGTSKMVSIKTTQQGLQDGWTWATFILRNQHWEELKALAYWERKTIKEVIDEALSSYLKGKIVNLRGVDK
jgi:hypothetical protein